MSLPEKIRVQEALTRMKSRPLDFDSDDIEMKVNSKLKDLFNIEQQGVVNASSLDM